MASQSTIAPLPYFFIGKELTVQRFNNYSQRYSLLTQAIGKPDTRSVWYSKEHITKLLDEINYANGDGMRVYFGAYESAHPEFSEQTCLMMVVTRGKLVGENTIVHENVSLENEPDFEERSSQPRDIPLWEEDDLSEGKRDFNHGSPCPPVCDGEGGFEFP